jgi:hypothetical protein
MSDANLPDVYTCFVIGPIGNKFAPLGSAELDTYEQALEVYEKVILPACQMRGIEPVRADQIAATGEINEQVFRHLLEDDIVIADVSGGNPNVMYELGLRHTRAKLTIPIGEFGQLPFDVAAVRTIQFSRSDRGLIDARKSLERALTSGLTETPEPVTATRVWLGATQNDVTSASTQPENMALDSEEEDPAGLLDRIQALEEKFPLLTESAEDIGGIIERMGAVAVDSTASLTSASTTNLSAAGRLTLVAKFAQSLQPSADDLTKATSRFFDEMTALDAEVVGVLDHFERHPEQDASFEFIDSILSTARAARETMENMSQFENSVSGLADMSRSLRRPVKQITDAVRTMVEAMALTDRWESKSVRVKQSRSAE